MIAFIITLPLLILATLIYVSSLKDLKSLNNIYTKYPIGKKFTLSYKDMTKTFEVTAIVDAERLILKDNDGTTYLTTVTEFEKYNK